MARLHGAGQPGNSDLNTVRASHFISFPAHGLANLQAVMVSIIREENDEAD
jgi:hypothetical protein